MNVFKNLLFGAAAFATLCGLSLSQTAIADNSSVSNNIRLVKETNVDSSSDDNAPGYHCRYKYGQ